MPKFRPAFTILEVFVVVVVIGILATMTMPRIMRKPPTTKWETVLDEMNNLVNFARQEAISNQTVYRIHFVSSKTSQDFAQIEQESDDPEKKSRKNYTKISSYYFNPLYTLPAEIVFQAVYHGKTEELEEQNYNAYCYIIPNGLVQETIIHLLKTEDGQESKATLKMSPFFGRFDLQEGFVKPQG